MLFRSSELAYYPAAARPTRDIMDHNQLVRASSRMGSGKSPNEFKQLIRIIFSNTKNNILQYEEYYSKKEMKIYSKRTIPTVE